MVNIVRTEWAGTSGGPGLTQMALENFAGEGTAQGAVDAVRAFWLAIQGLLPNELTLQVSPIVDVYNTETGQLTNSIVAPVTPAAVLGTAANVYAGGAGFKVSWETNQIKNGRRVRGSTFVVPASSGAYSATGQITSAAQTTVNTAAGNLLTALETNISEMQVWSRPKTLPVPRVGELTTVVQGVCSSKTAIQRSRRD